jgi:tRNA and rRNA cytosine-C5-methylases
MELPQAFKERMKQQLGAAYADFLATYEKERVCGLRYNPLKIEKEKFLSVFASYAAALEKVLWAEEGYYYPSQAHPGKLPLHEAGAYYIQEPSAMVAAALLQPAPGEKILDLCASPGGKSTQIAGQMQGRGLLVSNEMIPQRARTLSRNIERMGIRNAIVLNETPKRLSERFPLFFDRIIVDAPCSGEGMFRKDPDARGEWSEEQVNVCAQRQRGILSHAAAMLRPGGILVYSTCTFAPQENEQNAAWFAEQYPQFTLEASEHILPHEKRGEGHYAARFSKEQAAAPASPHTRERAAGRFSQKGNGRKKESLFDFQVFQTFLEECLSAKMQQYIQDGRQEGRLAVFGERLYLLPSGIGSLDGLKTERAGLELGCCKKNRFEPSHALAMALRPDDVRQCLELEEPERYLRGETLSCGTQTGWILLTVHGCSLGWGKASRGVLKNHYPKGLRRS